jgi:hypothetical protein
MNLYYNAAVDNDWNTLGNWWQDDQFTVPADALPTSADDVKLFAGNYGDEIFNSGPDAVANSVTGGPSGPFTHIAMNLTCSVFGLYVAIGQSGTVNIVDGTLPAEYDFLPGSRAVFDTWNEGTINGNCTFYLSNNYPNGVINGDCNFIFQAYNYGTVNGNATFDATSEMAGGNGVVIGDATFTRDGEWFYDGYISYLLGTVTGVRTFTGNNVSFKLNGSYSWTYDTTNWAFPNCSPVWSFYDSSYNSGTITGDCTFHDSSYSNGSITGDCTFYDYTGSGGPNFGSAGYIAGACTFNDYSHNWGNTYGACTFYGNSWNEWQVYGNCTFFDSSYNSYDSAVYGDATFNDTSRNSGFSSNQPHAGVFGNATFNDESWNGADGFVSLSATFNGNSFNAGTIGDGSTPALATFNDNAINGYIYWIDRTQQDAAQSAGRIRGNAVFRGNSRNEVNVTGTVTTDRVIVTTVSGINGSSILGIL